MEHDEKLTCGEHQIENETKHETSGIPKNHGQDDRHDRTRWSERFGAANSGHHRCGIGGAGICGVSTMITRS